ncbi:hypothetical protein Pfo_029890 [Paulownia fortunei]|nr:hypothetical protein Pfo_029890 [Paulownia fortunei]
MDKPSTKIKPPLNKTELKPSNGNTSVLSPQILHKRHSFHHPQQKGPQCSTKRSPPLPPRKAADLSYSQNDNKTPVTSKENDNAEELYNYEDRIGFPYEDPPLVCCFGAVQKEFVPYGIPRIRACTWGASFIVAISHVRLGARADLLGRLGVMRWDNDGGEGSECAEESVLGSELNLSVLKEARLFHFNSEFLTSPSMRSTLFKAISCSEKFDSLIFFYLALPLPLWKSLTKQELELLLHEDYYERRRNHWPQYCEISPLWHDRLKLLLVTDGTLWIQYYSPSFDGVVVDMLERQLRLTIATGIISQWVVLSEVFPQKVLQKI